MRYSNLFVKTQKNISKEEVSLNSRLLLKAGFVDKLIAGAYSYLPLGVRVLHKIENIIREEMDKIATEIYMPILCPLENFKKTKRTGIDVLMKASAANENSLKKNDTEYIMNHSAEETVTPLAQKFNLSYKDFPFATYQFQTKFRNEARPKSGLLRGREFGMKDLYSFHTTKEDLVRYYDIVVEAYKRVFNRLGIGEETVVALASGGDFSDDPSHEFQTKCESGEDLIFHDKKSGMYYNREEVCPAMPEPIDESGEEMKEMEDVLGEGLIGVEALAEFLEIPVTKTTKTILFETDEGQVVAAAVRGDYEIDEDKLVKVIGCKSVQLASKETVKRVTNAEVGYAGILNLPDEVMLLLDNSMKGRRNFESGANKTNYHTINVNFGRDIDEPEEFVDIKMAKEGDYNPETGEKYEVFSASEVGNTYHLDHKYTKAFDYKFVDEQGKEHLVYMGCYGIGTTRLMGVIAEKYNDENGLMWPVQVSPFHVHLISLVQEGSDQIDEIYETLTEDGIEVFYDDRSHARAGEKFNDADLIGIPLRIVIGKKGLESNLAELKLRSSEDIENVSFDALSDKIKSMLNL